MGKCEAEKVTVGTYTVPEGEGGMYGLVFDNTFSKTVSKTLTFVLMTYPANAPPKSGHSMHYAQAMAGASSTSLGARSSPGMGPIADSSESLPRDLLGSKGGIAERPKSSHAPSAAPSQSSSFLTGFLHKKRRKRNQGYARRFFSLDYTTATLSYYRNDHSSALRGAIPLSLAAVGANEERREISVDSGAEVWHLRASNDKDFNLWRRALDKASRTAPGPVSPTLHHAKPSPLDTSPHIVNEAEESEWARVEALVGRVAGTRDAVRRLAMDTDPKYHSYKAQDNLSPTPSESESTDYFPEVDNKGSEKKAFWKRKASSSGGQSPSSIMRRSVSAQVGIASPGAVPPVPPLPSNGGLTVPKRNGRLSTSHPTHEEGIHDHCMALLRDLDSVVADFAALFAESRARRAPPPSSAVTGRLSMESRESEEFFDAEDTTAKSQLLTIRRDSQSSGHSHEHDREYVSDGESESSSEAGDTKVFDRERFSTDSVRPSLYPTKPKSLAPLPLSPIKRRTEVPRCRSQAPNLLGLFRKNVGKDLSNIAMPVTTNEPTSGLQRLSEQLEYSELLDAAALSASSETGERLVYVTAFALSSFSNMRVKERAIRKPFNPMLGETFELVREDKGFRFIAEKVVHRPVIMACQAESQHWTFIQTYIPRQKFWGKSFELNTDGRARVFFHAAQEHYSWTIATSFLRNMIAGEKYIEPTGTMTIINENTGAKAVCTFKVGGMFAGRSEEVSIQCFNASGAVLPIGGAGKWTSDLQLTSNGQPTGKPIWRVGDLVANPTQHWGFTTFAASLNQITPIEDRHIPPTDSRLRPDQMAHEEGDVDRAEALKAELEERQRERRKVMEERGEEWTPRWFVRASAEEAAALGDEDVWRLRVGKEGYWECRQEGRWDGVTEVFKV